MAEMKYFRVEITRHGYWRDSTPVPVGAQIVLPDHAIDGLTKARPPFGRVIEEVGRPDDAQAAAPAAMPPGADKDVYAPKDDVYVPG